MHDILYITNRTDKPLHAVISDKDTGNSIMTCELQPGPNEIGIETLNTGVYLFCLSDEKDAVNHQSHSSHGRENSDFKESRIFGGLVIVKSPVGEPKRRQNRNHDKEEVEGF